jgi:hypothetical protein
VASGSVACTSFLPNFFQQNNISSSALQKFPPTSLHHYFIIVNSYGCLPLRVGAEIPPLRSLVPRALRCGMTGGGAREERGRVEL